MGAPKEAQAAGVEVYVQAPFDLQSQTFNLNRLDAFNSAPVFQKDFQIPYDVLEREAQTKLDELTREPFTGTEVCGSGILDPLCPDARWTVTLRPEIRFFHRGQPVLHGYGDAAQNGVRVTVDAKVRIRIAAQVAIDTSLREVELDIPIEATVGVRAAVNLNLYPTLQAQNLEIRTTWEGGNVDILGLNGEAIKSGAIIGTALGLSPLGPIIGGPLAGGIFGAITGKVAVDSSKDRIKGIILDRARAAIALSGSEATRYLNDFLQPQIQGANATVDGFWNRPLPVLGQSLGQLRNLIGVDVDVRSAVVDNDFRMAVTPRFRNAEENGRISGRVKLPKTACLYSEINDPTLGHHRIAIKVVPAPTDVQTKGCSAMVAGALKSSVYYGADPERRLRTHDSSNSLMTWGAMGHVASNGPLLDTPETFDCPFEITRLPNAAIVDLAPVEGSELSQRLGDAQPERSHRFLLVNAAGTPVLVNHEGAPVDPNGIELGGPGPSSVGDCPSTTYRGGLGMTLGDVEKLRVYLDPETCPQCNIVVSAKNSRILEVQNVTPLLERLDGHAVRPPLRESPGSRTPTIAPGSIEDAVRAPFPWGIDGIPIRIPTVFTGP